VISDGVDVAVASQKKIGIDIVWDGEFRKPRMRGTSSTD
jgi:hypothetical protein